MPLVNYMPRREAGKEKEGGRKVDVGGLGGTPRKGGLGGTPKEALTASYDGVQSYSINYNSIVNDTPPVF